MTKVIDVENFDRGVRPTDDFFQHVNGGWMKKNPVPDDQAVWASFHVLHRETQEKVHALLQEVVAEDAAPGSIQKKLRDFYRTGMNEEELVAQGASPVLDEQNMIESIGNINALCCVLGRLHRLGINAFWSVAIDQDAKNTEAYALSLGQGGLGLPDREYYFDGDKKEIREKYKAHIARCFELFGETADVEAIMVIETRLAAASMTRVELRDPEAQYNKMSFKDLKELAPQILWESYFSLHGIPEQKEVIVAQPRFLAEVSNILRDSKIPLVHLRIYLLWTLMRRAFSFFGGKFEQASFDFYGTVLSGQKKQKPRWERVLMAIDGAMGEALGQLYVEKYFSPEAKQRINDMIENLVAVYADRIRSLDWMSEATKAKALEKLHRITWKIGYPDVWRDYSALAIRDDSYIRNWFRAADFESARLIAKLGKPVDRTEWHMSPHTVNAYYNSPMNETVFPAGILQPPFFDFEADDAVNYGAIISVIGHELTHGFDDEGSQYDADGNLKDWWTKEDRTRFEERTKIVEECFANYIPIGNIIINGKLTLGENIADLGGLVLAFEALERALKGKPYRRIDGLTPHQRFFVAYAQTERNNIRDEELKRRLVVDPHSPGKYRVNGPLSFMQEFYDTFGCKKGDAMWRPLEQRVKIW